MEIRLQQDNEQMIRDLPRSGRIPHTVIIESGDSSERESAAILLAAGAVCESSERESAAILLAAGAVCESSERPCLSCNACRKVLEGIHPDVFIPEPSKNLKSGILSLKDLRDDYLSQMSVKPNEARAKVYIFRDADRLLREDAQNALLKTIEEPPQNLLFIFTVESAKSMLLTVRSRARIITLRRSQATDEESKQAAKTLIGGIISLYEYDLLRELTALSDKDRLRAALTALTEKLRLALAFYSGLGTADEDVKKLTRKLDRTRTIALIEATGEALSKLKTNVNLQLLATWLSSQYRRITWQK